MKVKASFSVAVLLLVCILCSCNEVKLHEKYREITAADEEVFLFKVLFSACDSSDDACVTYLFSNYGNVYRIDEHVDDLHFCKDIYNEPFDKVYERDVLNIYDRLLNCEEYSSCMEYLEAKEIGPSEIPQDEGIVCAPEGYDVEYYGLLYDQNDVIYAFCLYYTSFDNYMIYEPRKRQINSVYVKLKSLLSDYNL